MNDDNSTPLTVSVVMCTYNGKQFLREQMDSILAQDYPLHEIIVQDDRSTDDTWDILQTYAKAHPGLFKLFRNDEQLGFNRNFHTALLRATGQYVAISDQDDIYTPHGNPMHGAHYTGCTCSANATTASSTPTLHSTSTAASTPCRHA